MILTRRRGQGPTTRRLNATITLQNALSRRWDHLSVEFGGSWNFGKRLYSDRTDVILPQEIEASVVARALEQVEKGKDSQEALAQRSIRRIGVLSDRCAVITGAQLQFGSLSEAGSVVRHFRAGQESARRAEFLAEEGAFVLLNDVRAEAAEESEQFSLTKDILRKSVETMYRSAETYAPVVIERK